MIKIILADDHHLVRKGIRALLEQNPDFSILAEASDGYEAVQLTARLQPDVIVMDIAMPRLTGLQALEQIQQLNLNTNVVMLSMYSDETLVRQALRSGARGYLLKRSIMEELSIAIQAAVRNEIYLSPGVSSVVLGDLAGSTVAEQQLTPRELEVLKLISEGLSNQEISQTINISVKTVEKHRASLMEKLGVHDVPGLIRAAIRRKLIWLDDFSG